MNKPFSDLMTILKPAGLLCACLLLAMPAAAAEVQTTVGDEVAEVTDLSDLGLERVDDHVEITLEDAITAALRRNLVLVVQRYRHSQILQGVEEALGIYDLNLGANGGFNENTSPTGSTLEAADLLVSEGARANFNLSRLTSYGGTARLDFNNTRFESSNVFVQPNPQFGVDLDLSFSQPLLRNFGRTATDQAILIARTNSAISREDFQTQVEGIVQQIADSYWRLVEAREQLKVAQESLALAEELHEMNRIQVEVGTMAPLEMVRSEAGVATREEDIIRFQAAVEDGADAIRRLVNLDRRDLWDVGLVPVTDPALDHDPIDFDTAVDVALENRPDARRKRLEIKNRLIEAQVAHNQMKPQLDVSATFGYNALDGDISDPQAGILVEGGGYSDSLSQIIDREFDGWTLGFTFAYPLQNRTAKARKAQADLALEQVDVELRQLEQQILADVRQSARGVETAAKQIESAKVSSKLQRKNLEAEQKRYENGLSTSFEVLQVQEDLSEARSREVTAVTNYRRALTAFQLSIGKLLKENGIELAQDGT